MQLTEDFINKADWYLKHRPESRVSASDFTIYLLLQYVGQYGLTFIQISKNYNLHVWALWNGSSALQLSSVNLWHFQKIEDQPINLNSNLWHFGPINSSTSWLFHHYASLISCMRRYELHITLQMLCLSTFPASQHPHSAARRNKRLWFTFKLGTGRGLVGDGVNDLVDLGVEIWLPEISLTKQEEREMIRLFDCEL